MEDTLTAHVVDTTKLLAFVLVTASLATSPVIAGVAVTEPTGTTDGLGPPSEGPSQQSGTTVDYQSETSDAPPQTTADSREATAGATDNRTVTSSVSVTNNHATIDGWVFYQNQSGDMKPSPRTTVILRKRTTLVPTNKNISVTKTNESGYYSFQIDVANWESNIDGNDRLRLRVQALAHNTAVNVVNFWQNQGTANGNTYTVNNDGDINRGQGHERFNFSITSEAERRAFMIANWSLEVHDFTMNRTDWARRTFRVRYPAVKEGQAQFKSPFEKIVLGREVFWNRSDTRNVVHHENGHSVMSGLFDYRGWQAPEVRTWGGTHCIYTETARIFAWYEGWAQFIEAAVIDNPGVHRRSIETERYFNNTNLGGACPSGDTGDLDGKIVEGAIASILWDTYDEANEPHDEINGTLGEVFDAVNETDNAAWGRVSNQGRTRDIHDFFIQYTDNHPDRYQDLREIYFHYGIHKPDRFEHDRSGSGSCVVYNFPCEKMDGEMWSPLDVNTSINASLGATDIDYYRVDLLEEQRVTVNATVTDQEPLSSPDINVSVGAAKTATEIQPDSENGPHEEVTFTAAEDGTHYIGIGHDPDGSGPELTYELSINATEQPPQEHEEDDVAANATELQTFPIDDHINTTEEHAVTARYDHDYYKLNMTAGDRIIHARLSNGPGLSLAFEDNDSNTLQTVPVGQSMNTTTDPEGWHYFNVSGAARHSQYTLNVTVQRISQLYEENDRRTEAKDLDEDLELEVRPTNTGTNRGTTQCTSDQSNPQKGNNNYNFGNTGNNQAKATLCSRHDWRDGGYVQPGYAPNDPDWYRVTLQTGERINVSVPHEDLGVELHHGGQKITEIDAGDNDGRISHYVQSAGEYYINVTGDDYVPVYELYVWRFLEEGQDKHEPNDGQSTATDAIASSAGNDTADYDLLKLAGNDADYFSVGLDENETLNATMTHLESAGDVSLSVIGPSGATTTGTDPRPAIGRSATRIKQANVTAQQSGTYYVKVSGSLRTALKYNLTITKTVPASASTGSDIDFSNSVFQMPTISRDQLMSSIELASPPEFEVQIPQQPIGPGSGECSLYDTETRTRNVDIDAGQSTRIQETRTFTMEYPSPCRVVADIDGPDDAEVDVYVTVDGSEPGPNNYQFASTNQGSDERIEIADPPLLQRGEPIKVTVEGYPIEGTYTVVVEKYSNSP